MSQADLFATLPIPGLDYVRELVAPCDQQVLVDRLQSLDLAPFRFQRWEANRRTRTFGWRYDFEDSSFAPAEPFPDWLLPLRDLVARFAGVADFAHVLVARYDSGAGIGWHRDRDVFDTVVGVSLGSPAVLRFRRRRPDRGFDRAALEVVPGSAYRLSGEARWEWEHRIVPGTEQRFSITFRTLSDKGRRLAGQRSS